MQFRNIVITGGAGFIGSNLAIYFRTDFENVRIFALDNLRRRGSELNLARLKDHGIEFFHGDIRCPEDLDGLPEFDLLVDCSAEPSVQAGINGSPLDEPYIKDQPNYSLGPQKIPENNYFVLGDNRNNSNDSHNGWTVPRENIIGKSWLSIWPPRQWGLVTNYPLQEQLTSSTDKQLAGNHVSP